MCRYVVSWMCVLCLLGCGSTGEPAAKASKDKTSYKLAVIPKGTTHVFWKSVHAGALKAAEELAKEGITVEVQWKGALLENDREGQINLVQDFTAQGVNGIVLAPLDATALVSAVKEAKDSGIPTVIFDSGLADETVTVSYVATDNFNGGALAARELGKRLSGQGNVILFRYNVGSESTLQREEGFLQTLAQEFPDIKVLSSDQYAGITPIDAQNKALELLNQYGDKVDGMFAVCEPNTVGVLGALEHENLAGKVIFIGFDPGPSLVPAMAEKKIHGLVLQDPVAMGYQGVKTLVAHLRGQSVEKRVNTGEVMATPENMGEPRVKELLDPVQAD